MAPLDEQGSYFGLLLKSVSHSLALQTDSSIMGLRTHQLNLLPVLCQNRLGFAAVKYLWLAYND